MLTFKYGGSDGQEYQLVEASDLIVVRTEESGDLMQMKMSDNARSFLPMLIPVAAFPEANVMVYRIVAEAPNEALKVRNAIRRQLNAEENVRFAGRVLKDAKSGAIYIYTENIFVKFKPEVSSARCREILDEYQLTIKEELVFSPNSYFVCAEEGIGQKIFKVAENLLKVKEVEYCHPELVREKKEKFIYPLQWHLQAAMINGNFVDQHVNAQAAWQYSRGEGIVIAVIDDGVDQEHEEFSAPGKVVAARNTVRNENSARPMFASDHHGTACAGVACAQGQFKAAGVAPDARLMPIRSGGLGSMAEAKAFAWAADQGADVISCSWGPPDGPWEDPTHPSHFQYFALPDSTRLAMEYALARGREGKGCVICWAAGNGNEDVRYDGYATHPGVIAVAACNDRGRRSVYSDFGEAVWCCFPSNDFYAPQYNHPRPLTAGIWTTDRSGRDGYNGGGFDAESWYGDARGNYTALFGGTSSACPGVAGVAALILAINPELSWQHVKELIKHSTDKIDTEFGNYDDKGHSPYYGYGRVNAEKAVMMARETLRPVPVFHAFGNVHAQRAGVVVLAEGEWVGLEYPADRLWGLQLALDPFHPELNIRYRLFVNALGAGEWAGNGALAMIPDRRRKIIGVAIELFGPLTPKYSIEYGVYLRGRAQPVFAADGKVCGKASGTGPAVERLMVRIKKK
jgi:subtilisin family serine protease